MRSVFAALFLSAAAFPAAAAGHPTDDVLLVRVATFNASLNRAALGELLRDLSTPGDPQVRAVAEIIQRVRPDVLLLQEFDHDAGGAALAAFQANYLGVSQNGQQPIYYEHSYFTESNTGVPSGFDLDNDGRVEGGQDALGFGDFPGQYAMVLLSRFPIDREHVRTFRKFLWRDMPGALLPDDPGTRKQGDWYSRQELAVLPLSSKSHWDVPVKLPQGVLHLLVSHPTPPAFDGDEDRNGRRNHDEIRFWSDYLTPRKSRYIVDDQGHRGGWDGKGGFLILGDLNSDTRDGASLHEAILSLQAHRAVDSRWMPASEGGIEASAVQGGANTSQQGDPRFDTADFNDRVVGNLRVDYLLPSLGTAVCGHGVFWPRNDHPLARLVWGHPAPSSDHRLVFLDINAAGALCPPDNDRTASEPWRPRR
jgi:hypothetical protein